MKNLTLQFDRFLNIFKILFSVSLVAVVSETLLQIFAYFYKKTPIDLFPFKFFIPIILFFSFCYLFRFGSIWYVINYGHSEIAKLNSIVNNLKDHHLCNEERIKEIHIVMEQCNNIKNRFTKNRIIWATKIRSIKYTFLNKSLEITKNQYFANSLLESRLYELVNCDKVKIRYFKLFNIYYFSFIDVSYS